uniref:UBN2 domain-containing protein n=1 Tax=Cajanus cajan TaxID=3821 RepID=A0A151SKP6_CAJCA|nr:hypothetical protein KK1_001580 [Cajanus cajan]
MMYDFGIKCLLLVIKVTKSLNSHVVSVPIFNGLNFFDWNEHVQFHFSFLDLDLVILEEKPTTITDSSNDKEKTYYKAWEKSNKLSLMFIRMTITYSIKTTLPKTESAK